ncbi:MAG TPA: hypothetical protein IGP91_00790 [Thermosynechococcus sp. M46_R2017_013]|nr:hypothetical protein [Thermosynechococcus sp. M46_R2017_013]
MPIPPQLLRGADLVEQFHVLPGPRVGELLRAVEAAQARGEIGDRPQALAYVAQLLNSSAQPGQR